MLKVISLSKITPNGTTYPTKEILDPLNMNIGDEILFISDKNGVVHIRKFEGYVTVETGEKYISAATLTLPGNQLTIRIAEDVRRAINVDIGDKILWVLDSKGNMTIRNALIIDKCSLTIFGKIVGALIVDLTTLHHQNNIVQMPIEIKDTLELYEGDKAILSLNEYGNIIVSKEIRENLLQETPVLGIKYAKIYIKKQILDILDIVDKVLWLVDEEGNIIIKNNLLHDDCI